MGSQVIFLNSYPKGCKGYKYYGLKFTLVSGYYGYGLDIQGYKSCGYHS